MEVIFFPMKPTPVEVSFNLLFFKLLHEVFRSPACPSQKFPVLYLRGVWRCSETTQCDH